MESPAYDLYKTEFCRNWAELGHCRYGAKCKYAHGEHELRSVPRNKWYKTQICRAYHINGTCPYGVRCTFIHDFYTDMPHIYPEPQWLTSVSPRKESRFFNSTTTRYHSYHQPSPYVSLRSNHSTTTVTSSSTNSSSYSREDYPIE